ncbi:unnamed protein product [Ranitomeya imitator]|uniref:Reverse transcriptase domain-containing protein n=1 Tax=Ranitomeya imitator TaxID=111125 RepID=A0ABN9M2E0_9NEOB|nr:unnamed protein product [Ranitomeya imitator]
MDEKKALDNLSNNTSITIKAADKGDPTVRFQKELQLIVSEALTNGLIDSKLSEYLITDCPVRPLIYVLPKIHKDYFNPPGRPIVSGRDSIFNKVSIFLDKVLSRFASGAKSYIRDTDDFLNKLENVNVTADSLLVSFDVVSLYTSIEHDRGLAAVDVALSGSDVGPDRARLVLQLLEFILRRNYFLFGDDYYQQLRGTAMGSNVAPTYANIYMAVLEDQYVYVSRFWPQVRAWWRYIDDVFVVWEGHLSELLDFHQELNNIFPELSFTITHSQEQVQFLDTLVYKVGSSLKTDLYVKSTDRNSLLRFNSHHPRNMVESLPWSQMLRVRRIVADDSRLDSRLDEMCLKFLSRGYPVNGVKKHVERAKGTSIAAIREKKIRVREKRIPFVSTFNTASGLMKNMILKHWHILHQGLPDIEEFALPPILSYKRGRNLKDKLVKSDVGPTVVNVQRTLGPPKFGNFPCLGCACCGNMIKGDFFNHPRTGQRFSIRERYTCTSSFVIYLIVCPCGLTYVGETTMEIKARISKHKSTIRTKKMELPIPKHFIESGHSVSQLRFRLYELAYNKLAGCLLSIVVLNYLIITVLTIPEIIQRVVLDKYLRVLPPALKRWVSQGNPTTADQLVELVERYSVAEGLPDNTASPPVCASSSWNR